MPEKTNKEKMLAGELYNIFDPELESDRQRNKKLLLQFNKSESESEQQEILKQLVGSIGENSLIWPPFYCSYGRNIHMGSYVFLNYQCTILDNNDVRIGDHVMIGPNVQMYAAAHPLQAEPRNQGWEVAKAITIGDNVWIGGGAILLPGVTIGCNAVVGAGAVVSKDVPEYTVVAGNPAQVVRKIDQ